MRRYLADPVHAAVFHGGVGVEAAGDGFLDKDLAAFAQQFDLSFLDAHRFVDAGAFFVEKVCDGALFGEWRDKYMRFDQVRSIKCWICCSKGICSDRMDNDFVSKKIPND